MKIFKKKTYVLDVNEIGQPMFRPELRLFKQF